MNKRILTTLTAMACTALQCVAAMQWIDVTDRYVVNPRFDNNDITTGWQGTAFSTANPRENAEHYERNYDSYQTITGLTPGRYRLSLSAFYRMGDASNDYETYSSGSYSSSQHSVLYARNSQQEYTTAIVPASSAAQSTSLGGGSIGVGRPAKYIPNNMEAAYYWFAAGYYKNSVECTVGSDGTLTIGIRKSTTLQGDWTCLDNWKLEHYTEVISVSSITLPATSISLVTSEQRTLTPTVLPVNATVSDLAWTSSNTSVATVSATGVVTAIAPGTCTITASATDGSGKKATCTVTVSSNQATSGTLIINEIMAANLDVYMDPSRNYGSWVEIYNPTDQAVSLGGLYVTDDATNLTKHRLIDSYGAVPAHGFGLLNFDHFEVFTPESYRQIDDKLNVEGGIIIISDGKKILAQQAYPAAVSRTSYARTTDGGTTWGTTHLPSPGASNAANGGFASVQLAAPVVDKDPQLFSGTLTASVGIPTGATLRYTTDGTTPTLTNGLTSTTGLFTVSRTTTYRFRLYRDGYLPSPVAIRTYIYDDGGYNMPILSLSTADSHLNSVTDGLFKQGEYGRPGNGQSAKSNWNMDWDRPTAFSYFDASGKHVLSQEVDMSISGGWSRAWSPRSLTLKASKQYDLRNFFEAQFFDQKPYLKHKALKVRNGGNHYNGGRIFDAIIQLAAGRSGFNVDYQEWQPVHVIMNGDYYGTLNLREPNNKHHGYANYGIDTDEMDQFEICPDSGYVQKEGTPEAYNRLIALSANAADSATYSEIGKLLDLDEYINYMAIQLYIGNGDWPKNNVKGYRDQNDGRFHFSLFDLDHAGNATSPFNDFFNKEYYTFDQLYGYDYSAGRSITGNRLYKQITFVTLFKNLLKNDTFRKQFIDAFCIVGGSIYQADRVAALADEMAAYMQTGVRNEDWLNPSWAASSVKNIFTVSRNGSLTSMLKNYGLMKLSAVTRQEGRFSTNVATAGITYNGVPLPDNTFSGYFYAPLTLKAITPAGYTFRGWASDAAASTTTLFASGSSWSYYDKGSLDAANWTSPTYSTGSWSSGTAPLGYGKSGLGTTTTSGRSTYYFRKTFELAEAPADDAELTLSYTVDDGMIVYINGTEAARYNMPSGSVSYSTYSTSYAAGNPDTGTLTLPASLLQKGTNMIAVEVHNNNATSSDIMFDASLSLSQTSISSLNYVSVSEEYTLPTSGAQKLTAIFEPLSEEEQTNVKPVVVNEISAANSMAVNDYFKKNDWVELYNTTSADIDIAGMYMTDNAEKPKKYQVPTTDVALNTIIPAHGYKVIWCDKLDNIGADIHASFKLAAEGGLVRIATDTYSDQLTYPAHLGTQSFGRYPDGGSDTYVMNVPTIGKANIICTYDSLYTAQADSSDTGIRTFTREGSLTIAYVSGAVNIKSDDAPIASVQLTNAAGMQLLPATFRRAGGHFVTLSTASLPMGIYVVRATTESGDVSRIKFLIK